LEALSHHVVFYIDVEVGWHLITLILFSTNVSSYIYSVAEIMPNP